MKPRAMHRRPTPSRAIERAGITAVQRLLLAVACCAPHPSSAADRFDHRGAVGLLIGYGIAFKDRLISGHLTEEGSLVAGMLGGTYAIGTEGNELKLLAQGFRIVGDGTAWAVSGGYRGYFGQEQFKTFFDLDARADVAPTFALGPRLGFGVQFEALPTLGLFISVAAHAGAGKGLVFGAEAFAGIQIRSYLLE